MKLKVSSHWPPRARIPGEEEWEGAAAEVQKPVFIKEPHLIPGKLDGKESAACNWRESPVFLEPSLFHYDHLPRGDRIACAKFKEAVSKWFRLNASVFLEVQKTETVARAVPGNKLSGVYSRQEENPDHLGKQKLR